MFFLASLSESNHGAAAINARHLLTPSSPQAVKKFQRDPIEERIMQLEQIRANLSSTKARLEQDLAKAKARAAARAEKRASGG